MDLPIDVQKELLVCYDVGNLGKLSARRAAAILNVSLPTLKALLENRCVVEGRSLGGRDLDALCGYDPNDVYGLVETGLYYRETNGGRRKGPSAWFACNVTGTDKMRPLVTDCGGSDPGIVDDARAFCAGDGNVEWTAGGLAPFLGEWDRRVWPRRILLIHDNRSAFPAVRLRNIEIRRLPEGTVHPLGLSVARVAKTCERHLLQRTPRGTNADRGLHSRCDRNCDRNCDVATVSESVGVLVDAWESIISPQLIRNCFRKLGFVRTEPEDDRVHWNLERWADRRFPDVRRSILQARIGRGHDVPSFYSEHRIE